MTYRRPTTWRFGERLLLCAVIAALVVGLGLGVRGASAQVGREQVRSFNVDVLVQRDASLRVVETIDYDFGSEQHHGILRDVVTRQRFDGRYDRLYRLDGVKVTGSPGTPVAVAREEIPGGVTRLKIGDADTLISGRHTYRIEYRLEGVLNAFEDHDELYWNAIGHAWDVPITSASVVVRFEASGFAGSPEVACFAGAQGSSLACKSSLVEGQRATFAHAGLDAFEGMTVVVGFPKGVVSEPTPILSERWSFQRAFTVDPLRLGMAGALLAAVVAGVARLYWVNGRDWHWQGAPSLAGGGDAERVPMFDGMPFAAEYTPFEGLRPGQIGTLIDEVAHPLDVSASIVDLAARGHLTIEEVPKEGWFGSADWRMKKVAAPSAELSKRVALLDYERLLIDGLFEDGDEVLLSDLKTKFAARLKLVQDALYADTVARGWFFRNPSTVRASWLGVGVGALIVSIGVLVLVAWQTSFGLVGIVPVVGAIALIALHGQMPRRTAKGTSVLRHTLGFRRFIEDAETHRAEFAEKAGLFYEYLPYAIVFGCVERWAKAFEGLAMEPPSWYGSSGAFNAVVFAHAMSGFSTSTTGVLASTPGGSGSSGFGGGGFSGGGGGGGGGGSW